MNKIGFFINDEKFLNHAKALCASIIENLTFEDLRLENEYKIYVVTPEYLDIKINIPKVSQITVDIKPDVRLIPFVDKMIAAARLEEICDDSLIWLDFDSFFFKPVKFPVQFDIYINPVDIRNIGDLFGEERSEIWKIVCSHIGLTEDRSCVETSVSRERIFPYFNMGMVVINKQMGLFKCVKKTIFELLGNKEIKKIIEDSDLHRIFFHQVVFSCCLKKIYGENIESLPKGLNYPLHLHDRNPFPLDLEDIISIRYDDIYLKLSEAEQEIADGKKTLDGDEVFAMLRGKYGRT